MSEQFTPEGPKVQPVVVVDIDGVLFNTPAGSVTAFNKEHGTDYSVEDIFDYDAKHDKSKFVVNGVDYFHKHQLDTEAYSRVAGARAALQRIHQRGAKIIALTSRNPQIFRDQTIEAIDDHFGVGSGKDQLINEVFFAGDPDTGQHREKGEMIKEMGGHVLVDDAVRYCESAVAHGLPAILLSQPYNETGHNWPPKDTASNWEEAERLVEEKLAER